MKNGFLRISPLGPFSKRKLIKEFDSESAATLSESANVHGVAANVLLMKPGKYAKFF